MSFSTIRPCFARRVFSFCCDETQRATLLEYKSRGQLKADDLRRRREEQQVEIRRQKREENLSKRRIFLPASADSDDDESATAGWGDAAVSIMSRSFPINFCADVHNAL